MSLVYHSPISHEHNHEHEHEHHHDHDHDHDGHRDYEAELAQKTTPASISAPVTVSPPSSSSSSSSSYVPANKEEFRNYTDSARQERVEAFYREQHTKQTYDVVKALEAKYCTFDRRTMSIWEALEYANTFVDDSDPDTSLPQLQHALQTAESIRLNSPYMSDGSMDWFPLVGLIHDLGKILSFGFGEAQCFNVGDSFPVGCSFSDKNVFSKYFEQNPDRVHPIYSTFHGIYKPNCGLAKVTMSWGHDEYLYRVCVANGSLLPPQALYMIRFHSFYPWHKEGAYNHLTDVRDREMLHWVREFNQYDLYSKSAPVIDVEKVKPYYLALIDKYFPTQKLKW